MAYDELGILNQIMGQQQGILSNPQDAALMQLGLGLLAQSGPSPRKVGTGEAFGKAGIGALDTYQQQQLQQRRERMAQFEMMRRMKQQEMEEQYKQFQMMGILSQAKQREAEEERKRRLEQGREQAMGRLGQAMALPTEDEALRQMREMDARGEQGSVRAQTPAMLNRLALEADPTGALMGRMAQAQRPMLVGPGTGVLMPGQSVPDHTQPFAPRQEPRPQRPIVIQGPNGPQYADPADAIGKPPPTPPAASKADAAASQSNVTAQEIKRRITSMTNIVQSNPGIVGPAGIARRIGETGAGIFSGGIETPALDYQNELRLLVADVRKMVEKDPNLSNEERRNLYETLGGGTMQTPGSAVRALNNVMSYVENKAMTGATQRQQSPQVGSVIKGYRFMGGDPANPSSWQKAD